MKLRHPTQNVNVNGQIDARAPGDGPFCWQTKAALRLIRDYFDATGNVSTALAVYVALSEIASDEQSAVFDTTTGHIAKYAGLSARTAGPIVTSLAALGLVNIKENTVPGFIPGSRIKAPSTYQVLSLRNHCVASNDNGLAPPGTLGNHCVAFARQISKKRDLPISEESPEQSPEKSPETRLNQTQATQPTPGGVCRERNSGKKISRGAWRTSYQVDELYVIDLYNQVCPPRGWLKVNRYAPGLQNALRDWLDSQGSVEGSTLQAAFEQAADERDEGDEDYNAEKGNRLIRILWKGC